ncbi:MAG: lysophospholipid acyltransferase family protein [Egibacteraceae bacterium]
MARAASVVFLLCARVGLRWTARTRVVGQLPSGGCLLASNHVNYIDGPLAMTLDWRRVRPIAKPNPDLIVRIGFALTRTIVTGREATDEATAHLHRGGIIWMAPEGQINTDSTLRRPRTGTARIAAGAGVPIVPMALIGTRDIRLRAWRPWRRWPVTIVLGPATAVPSSADPGVVMDEVMRWLAATLDRAYCPRPPPRVAPDGP